MGPQAAQSMTNIAGWLGNIANGGVQANEQAQVADLFSRIFASVGNGGQGAAGVQYNGGGQNGAGGQWSPGEQLNLFLGALKYIMAGQDPTAQGHALQQFSNELNTLAKDDLMPGGGQVCQTPSMPAAEQNCGCSPKPPCSGGLEITEPNTVDTGNYLIKASGEGGGTVQIIDKSTGAEIKDTGDPHLSFTNGSDKKDVDKTDHHQQPVTITLPDGAKVTITPTKGDGATYVDKVLVTRGNDAVEITGIHDNKLQTAAKQGGQALDAQTPDGVVLTPINGDIANVSLPNGTELKGNSIDNIDKYAQPGGNAGFSQLTDAINNSSLPQEYKNLLTGLVNLLGQQLGGPQQGQQPARANMGPGMGPGNLGLGNMGPGNPAFGQVQNAVSALPQADRAFFNRLLDIIGQRFGGFGGLGTEPAPLPAFAQGNAGAANPLLDQLGAAIDGTNLPPSYKDLLGGFVYLLGGTQPGNALFAQVKDLINQSGLPPADKALFSQVVDLVGQFLGSGSAQYANAA